MGLSVNQTLTVKDKISITISNTDYRYLTSRKKIIRFSFLKPCTPGLLLWKANQYTIHQTSTFILSFFSVLPNELSQVLYVLFFQTAQQRANTSSHNPFSRNSSYLVNTLTEEETYHFRVRTSRYH
jgi:hypothetical protein